MEVLEELEANVVHTMASPPCWPIRVPKPGAGRTPDELPVRNGGGMQLPVIQNEHVKILIGPENVVEELKDSSVIMASYNIGGGMQGSSAWWAPPAWTTRTWRHACLTLPRACPVCLEKTRFRPPAEPHPEDKEE